jgi:hypothetical protein
MVDTKNMITKYHKSVGWYVYIYTHIYIYNRDRECDIIVDHKVSQISGFVTACSQLFGHQPSLQKLTDMSGLTPLGVTWNLKPVHSELNRLQPVLLEFPWSENVQEFGSANARWIQVAVSLLDYMEQLVVL